MRYQIRYHNTPHKIKFYHVALCPIAKGITYVHASLHRGGGPRLEIGSYGYDPHKFGSTFSVYFDENDDLRAELRFIPETKEEGDLNCFGYLSKGSDYHAILVESHLISKAWEKHAEEHARLVRARRR